MLGSRTGAVGRRAAGHALRLLAAAVCAAALTAMLAPPAADASLVSAADGNLAAFTGGLTQVNGTVTAVSAPYRTDNQVFAANYSGSGGGSASGAFQVQWTQGQSVAYGAAFDLASSFHAATEGQQTLLRWESSEEQNGAVENEGIVVNYSDNTASLIDTTLSGGLVTQRVLAGPFPLPIGSWFRLQVRQLLGAGSAAFSDVYVNGKLVATSREPNFAGTSIDDVRFGIVDLSAGADQGPVTVMFDQATAANYTGYVNPLGGDFYITGRTDMGVDFCLDPGEPIRAAGDGTVVGIDRDWFRHQPYIWYQLLDGPDAGRYVYVAEQIRGLARVGTALTAGQPLAYYKKRGTCIETGWSAASGATLAQVTTGYYEGEVTKAGVSFAHFLISVGVQGPFELHPPVRKHRKHPKQKQH